MYYICNTIKQRDMSTDFEIEYRDVKLTGDYFYEQGYAATYMEPGMSDTVQIVNMNMEGEHTDIASIINEGDYIVNIQDEILEKYHK